MKGENTSGKEVEKRGEQLAYKAGSAVDSTVSKPNYSIHSVMMTDPVQVHDVREKLDVADAKIGSKAHEADAKFQQLKADGAKQFDQARSDTARELKETADKFDKTVEKKTVEAKAGISSWFGFGK